MSTKKLKKLKAEQAAVAKKIGDEKRKFHAKIGADLVRAFGDDSAAAIVRLLAAAAKATSPEATLSKMQDALNTPPRRASDEYAGAARRVGGAP